MVSNFLVKKNFLVTGTGFMEDSCSIEWSREWGKRDGGLGVVEVVVIYEISVYLHPLCEGEGKWERNVYYSQISTLHLA